MKKDIHPDYHMIKVQMTDGTVFRNPLHMGQGRRHAAARYRSPPRTRHGPVVRGSMLDAGGRVAQFNKRFGGLTLKK